jgi:hypothetical protein
MGGVLVDSVLGLIAVFGHNSFPSTQYQRYFRSRSRSSFVPLVRHSNDGFSGNGLVLPLSANG